MAPIAKGYSLRIFRNETLRCLSCKVTFAKNAVRKKWQCPMCGDPISVIVRGTKFVYRFLRTSISDVRIGDFVAINEQKFIARLVFNVNFGGKRYFIAVKGHGGISGIPANAFINILKRRRKA